VCSISDYDAPIYGLATKPQLTISNPIQNSAIRSCTSPSSEKLMCWIGNLPSTIVPSPSVPTSSPLSVNSQIDSSNINCSTLFGISQSTDKPTPTCACIWTSHYQKVQFHCLPLNFPSISFLKIILELNSFPKNTTTLSNFWSQLLEGMKLLQRNSLRHTRFKKGRLRFFACSIDNKIFWFCHHNSPLH